MKREVLLFIFLLPISYSSVAQNIGIGTATPASKLHVKGTGSGTQIVLEENAGSILRISNEPSGTGPYIGTTTNNPLSLVTNNTAKLTISTAGYIGIGQSSPTSPLHFSNTLGSKLALWGTNPNHYGIGIQAFQMQFYTPANTDDFVFGHGNSSAMTETMRIKGNGNVGIGTNNPQKTLDVNGDINIQNRLFLNNSPGNDGQVLVSNGNAAPSWQNVAYGNNDRFLFKTVYTTYTTGLNNLIYSPVYTHSSAITHNNGLFTVNKSGFYSFKGHVNSIVQQAASNITPPFINLIFKVTPPSSANQFFYINDPIDTYYSFDVGSNTNYFRKSIPFNFNYYLPAGSQFGLEYSVASAGALSSIIAHSYPLEIHLVSE